MFCSRPHHASRDLLKAVSKRGNIRRRAIVSRMREEDEDYKFTSSCMFEDVTDSIESVATSTPLVCTRVHESVDVITNDVDTTYTYRIEVPPHIWDNLLTLCTRTERKRHNLKQEIALENDSQLHRLIKMFDSITVTDNVYK